MVYHRCPHMDGHGPFLKPCVTYYPKQSSSRGSAQSQRQQQGGGGGVTETVMDWEPTFLLHPDTWVISTLNNFILAAHNPVKQMRVRSTGGVTVGCVQVLTSVVACCHELTDALKGFVFGVHVYVVCRNYMFRSWANKDHRLLMVKYTPNNESAVAAALSQDDESRDRDGVAFLGRQYK